jgi:hypothetical protein
MVGAAKAGGCAGRPAGELAPAGVDAVAIGQRRIVGPARLAYPRYGVYGLGVGWTVGHKSVQCIGWNGSALQTGPGVRKPGELEGQGLRRGFRVVGAGRPAGAAARERRGWSAGWLLAGSALCDADPDLRPVPSVTGCWVLLVVLGGTGAATATWASC